ncbi:hypothetical protein MYSTI_04220 [Myxococcus stipitatus DSM 14675]|uniref:Uncharacterized protein n=1 Tax=Myxococcus stipitatus (strain DSM 14675 / JCM 12634 / Mx s8) TaxID=1278073 RepID=L7UBT6_MYXSD|nr:hypothetical protein [Myxococcus stipitatus]AGC45518.1 hypothetical protein MYSTI_04220 [Myxococcus stipitatus DSM 14675]
MRNRLPPLLPFLVLAVAASTAMAAAPSSPPPLKVVASPARVLLGRDSAVSLQVRVPAGTGPVWAAASSGRFAKERLDEGAVREFQWTPPSVRHPLMAVFVFWVEAREGPPETTVFRLPLSGHTTLDVATAPGASVEVWLGEARFGPVQANARGKARVRLEVPPGISAARVLATRGALRTDAATPLDVPRTSPRVVVLTPSPLPASGGWLLVAGDVPLDAEFVKPSIDGATLEDATGQELARFRVVPAPEAAVVTARVRGDDAREARTQATVLWDLPPGPPASWTEEHARGSWRPALHLLVGGTFARGENSGPSGALGASVATPWWAGRLAAELELGVRGANFRGPVGTLGEVRSQLLAVPVLASVRAEVFDAAAFTLHIRAGGGVAPFRHHLRSDFQAEVKESKLSGMAFMAIQGAYRFGRWSALGEVRGAWAPARTPLVDAQLGGVSTLLGMRFEP